MDHAARAELQISVNGDPQRVAAGSTVSDLIRDLGLEGRRVAVAINREVVPRSRFDSHAVDEGDQVEVLEAVGGG